MEGGLPVSQERCKWFGLQPSPDGCRSASNDRVRVRYKGCFCRKHGSTHAACVGTSCLAWKEDYPCRRSAASGLDCSRARTAAGVRVMTACACGTRAVFAVNMEARMLLAWAPAVWHGRRTTRVAGALQVVWTAAEPGRLQECE